LSTATPSLSDARLARRAVRGNSRAFEAIFRRYHQQLYRYCAAIVGNSADAQDAVQNTMVKVLQALPGEERRVELKPWLYRIAHNEAIEIVRRRPPAEAIDADSLLGPANAAEQVESRERLWQLVADVAELPERQRGALVMRELGGLGFEEIGAALGTSAATARQTLYEARLGLRAMSEGREMDCSEAMRAISDGDRRLFRGRRLSAHLRGCEGCRAFRAGIEGRRADLALVAPLPAVASAGILHGVLGLGGGAAGKSLFGVTAIKTAAAVGVIAAVGVTAADRSGLIQIGPGQPVEQPAKKSGPLPAGTGSGSGAHTAPPAPAPLRDAVRDGGAVAPGPALSGLHPVDRGVDRSTPPRHPQPGSEPAVSSPPSAPAATDPAPPAEAPAHTDNGRHLGQLKHPEPGHPAAGGGSKGKSATAPGHTKPSPGGAAQPEAPKAKPSHPEPQHPQPPPRLPPGQVEKTSPATAAGKPAAEHVDAAPAATAEGGTGAESPPAAHGKSGAESATP